MARVLLRLASAAGERLEGGAVRITLPLSRQDIADMAGTVIETAIRTMSKFQKQGLIETREGRIVLLKPHRLVAIADELYRRARPQPLAPGPTTNKPVNSASLWAS